MKVILNGLLVAATGLFGSTMATADVTLESNITIKGGGSFSMLNSTGTQTLMLSEKRARMESTTESESKMLKAFAKNANTASIVRLDEEVMQNLVPEKKQYSEMTFEEMSAMLDQAMSQSAGMGSGLPVNDESCEWSEPDLQVSKTGEKAKFAGISARQTLIEASQTCTDPSTGKQCKMTWSLDYWIARKMPGQDEIKTFTAGMAKAMGGDDQLSMVKMQASGLMGMFKRGWDEILTESGDMKGYPVKSVMSLKMGGDQCTMPGGQNIAMDGIWSEAASAGADAAAGTAAGHAGQAIQQETAEALGDSVGGSVAGSAVGAASQKLLSGAFSKFKNRGKKKKEEEKKAAQAEAAANDGNVMLFTITSELVDDDQRDLAMSNFEVPAGWKKVEADGWQ